MFTSETTVREIYSDPRIRKYRNYSIYGQRKYGNLFFLASLSQLSKSNWNIPDMNRGIERLKEAAVLPGFFQKVYSDSECRDDRRKKDVNLMFFPSEKHDGKKKPFIIVCAGGAYTHVCNMTEAYPVCRSFNELGFDCFALNYRVSTAGVMPMPLDDLAAAIKYIDRNCSGLLKDSDPSRYAVCGFSAGGNLTAEWGSKTVGYEKYGIRKPAALLPIYGAVSCKVPENGNDGFLKLMFGENYTPETAQLYDVPSHIDDDYPPCYIVCCEDDPLVPYSNSTELHDLLEKNGVKSRLLVGKTGGHGYGVGTGTSVEGWPALAAEFLENL